MVERKRRIAALLVLVSLALGGASYESLQSWFSEDSSPHANSDSPAGTLAVDALEQLPIKGRVPKTGYAREQFGAGWSDVGSCDMRNFILGRDMTEVVTVSDDNCAVVSGTLNDPYTAQTIHFTRSNGSQVQVDHVVALSDAWQKGAQQLTDERRAEFYNDPLNLLAVHGPTNQQKGDGDAATWLPPNKSYRCRYVARQVAVKLDYGLWVTQAEHDAIKRILQTCPSQTLPSVTL